MKKKIPFCLIIVSLIALTVGSEWLIDGKCKELQARLVAVETAVQSEDFATATTAATDCIAYFDQSEDMLVYFMPSETLHLLEATIYGMECYIKEENRTEALAEAARAHAQLGAVWTVYFRMI